MRSLPFLAAVVLSAVGAPRADAVMVAAKHVDVELVADVAGVAPGQTFRLGVRFVPEKNWHVYWKNPGDSGEAPRIQWMLPAGLTAGELEWPTPERIPVGPLVNIHTSGSTPNIQAAVPAPTNGLPSHKRP